MSNRSDSKSGNVTVTVQKADTWIYMYLVIMGILCYICYQLGTIAEKISWDEQQILDIQKEMKKDG